MNILFPYERIREVQGEFVKDIIETLEKDKHLIAHAPTGIGKTAACLSTILPKIIKEGKTLFFLTSRHTQHKIAIETLKQIKEKYKEKINVVDFIGKRLMCNQFGVENLPASQFYEFCRHVVEKKECEFYENTFAEIGITMESKRFLFGNNEVIEHVEEFMQEMKKTKLCPYEIALLKAKRANVIIADYYHVFNSGIREAFFKRCNKFLEKSIIVVDEAHNLPERLREMMSSSLSVLTIERALKEAEPYKEAFELMKKIENKFNFITQSVEEERLVKKNEFEFEDIANMLKVFDAVADDVIEIKKRSFIKIVSDFLKLWLNEGKEFVRIMEKKKLTKRSIFSLKYRCLDPSLTTREIINTSQLVLMSGTLTPLEMYRDLLGFKAGEVSLKEYENPFPHENRLNLIVPDTTTKFTKRNFEMYSKIAEKCVDYSELVPGNTAIFFPSYMIMDIVYEIFKDKNSKAILLEKQGMTKDEKEELLNKFRSYKEKGSVLFAVSGASFSEGIDLPGDELKSVIIVGLPLSRPDLETRELINYFDQRFGRGWDYAYIFPAMIRVIQSAGRCIRSEEDKGVIVFLDERYSLSNYFRCFPNDFNAKITKLPQEHIRKFFTA